MALEVSYHNPDFPDEMEFDVGIGVPIPNGKSVTLSEDQELYFVASHQEKVKDYYKDSETVKVSGTTALSAQQVKDHLGVEASEEAEVSEEAAETETEEGLLSEGGEG